MSVRLKIESASEGFLATLSQRDDRGKVVGHPSVFHVSSKEEAKRRAKTLARSLGLKVYGIVDKATAGAALHPSQRDPTESADLGSDKRRAEDRASSLGCARSRKVFLAIPAAARVYSRLKAISRRPNRCQFRGHLVGTLAGAIGASALLALARAPVNSAVFWSVAACGAGLVAMLGFLAAYRVQRSTLALHVSGGYRVHVVLAYNLGA